ncbi:phage holin family protein, partial [Escherichia coli]
MLSLDFNNEVVKAAPIVGTGVADGAARLFFGLSLNEWFYVAAIAYTVAQ